MHIRACTIPDILCLRPERFVDGRGFFTELYNKSALGAAGIVLEFCQDNLSHSIHKGTVRGLHFQKPPFTQAKLVTVMQGAILDVVVDLRRGSNTFGMHAAVELTAEAGEQIFIPGGFAHGFCALAPDTLVFYKSSAPYARGHDAGIFWADPDLGIDWPIAVDAAILSEKDKQLPRLRDLPPIFHI